ncbi:MAG TPA: FtsX-like permease family protein [Anaerolineales bacterium]
MIWKNLLRRKGRTGLTVLGISLGVSAIIALGTMAQGLEEGYGSMLGGSQADLVLSQPDAIDITYSSLDEGYVELMQAMPEVAEASGMLQTFLPAENAPYFFVFGYEPDSFVISRFNIIRGVGLDDLAASRSRGRPALLGSTATEVLDRDVGDTVRLGDTVFRVVGVYETGDAFEDSGAVLSLQDAQVVAGKARQVSLVYVQLTDRSLQERLETRVARLWDDLALSTTDDFANNQLMGDTLQASVWAIASLAIVIGGVGMTNAQLMAVFERTREIGVLRAVGWSRRRVMSLILGESMIVGLLGGLLGLLLGWLMLLASADVFSSFGADPSNLPPGVLVQALGTVILLGMIGGIYPAWQASRLQPLEALRYEGGSSGGDVRRLPIGGMAVQSLWQRSGRTLLTLSAIALTVGAVMAMDAIIAGTAESMTSMATSAGSEIVIRQADVADTSLSAIDQRLASRIAALPGVRSTSGMVLTALLDPASQSFLIVLGYSPNEYSIQRFNMVEGQRISGNHQIMLGSVYAEAASKDVGDTLEISGARFRVVGIYETGIGWEEMGGVVSLRDAQTLTGRPNKVTLFSLKLERPTDAPALVDTINQQFPELHAALAGEFVEQMPDMESGEAMLNAISSLAILVGGVGILNTMLMAVLERTREIGVLRTMGWRKRRIIGMIMNESLILSVIGGIAGLVLAFLLVNLLTQLPMVGAAFEASWSAGVFLRAGLVALGLGLIGGLYPAYRASGLQPVEALRYE